MRESNLFDLVQTLLICVTAVALLWQLSSCELRMRCFEKINSAECLK